MSELVGTLITPVVIFYVAGCLLSFGYFQGISPALLTVFTPTELAMAGLSRITASLASLSVFAMFLALIAAAIARRVSTSRPKPVWNRLIGVLCILNTAMMVFGLFSMGIFSSLLGIAAIMLIGIIGVALLFGWEERLRETAKPFFYVFVLMVSLLGLLALGEGSFTLAMTPRSAERISVPVNGVMREAALMALGSGAMIYHLDNCFYVSGPRGESPLKVNCRPQGMAADS